MVFVFLRNYRVLSVFTVIKILFVCLFIYIKKSFLKETTFYGREPKVFFRERFLCVSGLAPGGLRDVQNRMFLKD